MSNPKVLILGAGYGTRLQRDILADPTESYTRFIGVPKALLPLGSRDALITHWLDNFVAAGFSPEKDIYVVSNAHMYPQFLEWASRHGIPSTHILNDGSETNETRLGAVADIDFAVASLSPEDDVVVVGGDTLFLRDFNLTDMLAAFAARRDGCLVTAYEVDPSMTHKYGIAEFEVPEVSEVPQPDRSALLPRLTTLHEKPQPGTVSSRSAIPCFYMFKSAALPLISEFLAGCRARGASLEEYDATGKILAYICPKFNVFAWRVAGRIDVGGLQSYIEAQEYFADGGEGSASVRADETKAEGMVTEGKIIRESKECENVGTVVREAGTDGMGAEAIDELIGGDWVQVESPREDEVEGGKIEEELRVEEVKVDKVERAHANKNESGTKIKTKFRLENCLRCQII